MSVLETCHSSGMALLNLNYYFGRPSYVSRCAAAPYAAPWPRQSACAPARCARSPSAPGQYSERAASAWPRQQAAAESASKSDIGWGHQIRSYVLQPYQLVKDLRTGVESTSPQDVLDGALLPFMEAALAHRVGGDNEAAAG